MRVIKIGTATNEFTGRVCLNCGTCIIELDATICEDCALKYARQLEALIDKIGTDLERRSRR